MRAIPLPRFLFAVTAAAVLTACNNPLALPPPLFTNSVDTATIYALQGTDVTAPSAYDVVSGKVARTDLAQPFDFAFDIDSAGTPILYPEGALGISPDAGIAIMSQAFDSITTAPSTTYQADSTVAIEQGTVFVVRSRVAAQNCSISGSLPRYGKFRVLGIDRSARSLTFEMLVDLNCGYRSLEPGTPTQ